MATREQLCTEEEVTFMVHDFYRRVRADDLLGPIFNEHVKNWDTHLQRMVNFWSSMLRGTGAYGGSPMPVHIALPNLSAELFQQWLKLFHQTIETLPNKPFGAKADSFAHRIARSLWYGYQLYNKPETAPTEVFNA